jgi:hypothetical protein
MAIERLDPVAQATQARARVVGTAHAVVTDCDLQAAAGAGHADRGTRRMRVLGHVG